MRSFIAGTIRTGASAVSRQAAREVIGTPVRSASHEVGRGRRDHDRMRRSSKRDVVERLAGGEQLGVNRAASQCLERDRSDELPRRSRHDDINFGARLAQQSSEPRCLVTGDPAGDPEDDPAVGEGTHARRKSAG